MKVTVKHNERIANMTFASVYPHYVNKVEKKGRTKVELHQVIEWLTGYDELRLQDLINKHSNPDDLVLDCFAGSASCAVACSNTGRNFIGCELDETFYNKSIERINKLNDKSTDVPPSSTT